MHALKHDLKPFTPFLENPGTTDIVVNRCGEIGAEIDGQWEWHDAPELDFDTLDSICIQTAFYDGKDISPEHPIETSPLPGGERCHMVRPNATDKDHISLTIRRPPGWRPTVSTLKEKGMFTGPKLKQVNVPTFSTTLDVHGTGNLEIDSELAEKLSQAVVNKLNILICGATGSAKSTLANALADCIPEYERIITVEDVREWRLKHRNWVPTSYSKDGQGLSQISAKSLIESALRMRPDRVLVGELRDDAAYFYLRSTIAGHPGGITTLHADSAEGAFDAIVYMIREHQAGAGLQNTDIYDMLKKRIDIVLHCKHDPALKRYWIDDVWTKENG